MRKPCSVRNILKNSGQTVFKTGGYDRYDNEIFQFYLPIFLPIGFLGNMQIKEKAQLIPCIRIS